MPNWKKLIISGSSAELSGLKLTDLSTQESENTTLVINSSGVIGTREDTPGTPLSLSVIGSTPNVNSATLTDNTLNLQPASINFGGVVTTGTQSFAGEKIFTNDLVVNGINIGKGPAGNAASSNTIFGAGAGQAASASTAADNVAIGCEAMYNNLSGFRNTTVGNQALFTSTDGCCLTAVGFTALYSNTTGCFNTALGYQSMYSNTTGNESTAVGANAILSNTTGKFNTAVGSATLLLNAAGSYNTAVGTRALRNSTQNGNTAIGSCALGLQTGGSNNTSIGKSAGTFIADGTTSNLNFNNSVYVGSESKPLGNSQNNQIVIGYQAIGQGANTVTIGNSSITKTQLRGTVKGGSFKKDGGLATQYLMADGSVTTDTNTQLSEEQVEDIMGAAWISGTNNTFVYNDANGTLKIDSTNTQRGIDQTPTENAFGESISSNWAFDNVKTAVPAGAVFTDTNTNTQLSDAQVRSKFSAGTNVAISNTGVISSTDTNTDTNTQLTSAQIAAMGYTGNQDLSGYLLNTTDTLTGDLTVSSKIKLGDGGNGYFFTDSDGRTAFTGGQFYIQSGVGTYYNYATNQYHGNSSGDNHYFRGNPLSGNCWSISATGTITTTTDLCAGGNTTIGDGHNNSATLSSVLGGQSNIIDSGANYSTIGGGIFNCIYGACSFLGGGYGNKICANSSARPHTIGGGALNNIDGCCSNSILGGTGNKICNCFQKTHSGHNAIVGGYCNKIEKYSANSFIGGGAGNKLCGNITTTNTYQNTDYGVIGGGYSNQILGSAPHAVVAGGCNNTITGGILGCQIQSKNSSIGGGCYNQISNALSSFIGGGESNTLYYTCWSTIGGGGKNNISGCSSNYYYRAKYSTIIGGECNVISKSNCGVITGGTRNCICSTGYGNAILGGTSNYISGGSNSALLGYNNSTAHSYSNVFGFNLSSTAHYTTYMNNATVACHLQVGGTTAMCTTTGRIDATNDVVSFATSDRRLKCNIKPIENALCKVIGVTGNTFDWKELTKEETQTIHGNTGRDVGVIAQEIEAILPEAVTTRDSGYKAVNYEKIVPLLIEAIKEQQNQINELKSKL